MNDKSKDRLNLAWKIKPEAAEPSPPKERAMPQPAPVTLVVLEGESYASRVIDARHRFLNRRRK